MLLALVLAFVVLVLLCLLCCRHTKTAVADDHNDDDNVTLRNYPRNKRKAHQTQQDGGTLRQGSSFDVNVTNDFSDEEKGTQIRGNGESSLTHSFETTAHFSSLDSVCYLHPCWRTCNILILFSLSQLQTRRTQRERPDRSLFAQHPDRTTL